MGLFNKKKNEELIDNTPETESDYNSDLNQDSEENEYYESEEQTDNYKPTNSKKKKGLYPREYLDPCDIYLGKDQDGNNTVEEYYFNPEKTFRLYHLGFLWNIFSDGLREKIIDFCWDKDWLHDISAKQHQKSEHLNSLTASGQLAYDISRLFIKIAIILALIFGIWGYDFFVKTPNEQFDTAITLLQEKKYTDAKSTFELLNGKKSSNIYIQYCNARIALSENRFDDAKKIFEDMTPDASKIGLNNIEDLKKECVYQKAIYYYNKGEWQTAIDVIIPVIKYSNSAEYYEKCQYRLADMDYESGDYYKALEKFNTIASYDNAQDRMNGMMSSIYAEGMNKYKEQDYLKAAEIFNSIVPYKYLDSAQMSTQCFYQSAQDLFAEEDYLDAKELFEQIPQYKDSQTMVKECLYRTLDSKDYTKNILNMLSLQGYRDVSDILKTKPYNIYAEWIVSEINGRTANNETFIFNTDGDFLCDEPNLPSIAISNDELKYHYYWDDNEECFKTQDDKYQIYIEDFNIISYTSNTYVYITLKCIGDDKETLYKCQKINELDEYYEATVIRNTADTSDYELIQAYLDEMKKKEQSNNENSLNNSNNSNEENIENTNESNQTEENEVDPIKKKSFVASVLRVYDDALLVAPDTEYSEAEISDRYVVLYDDSSTLEKGDIISVMYIEDINTESEPPEIEAYKVKYIGNNSESNESDSNSESEETTNTTDNGEAEEPPILDDSSNNGEDDENTGGFFF